MPQQVLANGRVLVVSLFFLYREAANGLACWRKVKMEISD
jgi:hypothetical protein